MLVKIEVEIRKINIYVSINKLIYIKRDINLNNETATPNFVYLYIVHIFNIRDLFYVALTCQGVNNICIMVLGGCQLCEIAFTGCLEFRNCFDILH